MPDFIHVLPADAHNAELVGNVHPPDWKNPVPDGRYNLVVVGAGTAGLITSLVAASLGARVALVERHLMGGDCLNVGCVPSKAVIRAARRVHEARAATALGLEVGGRPDFGAAMERMRAIRARISEEDSAARYSEEFGVDVYLGDARFTGAHTLDVEGTTLEFAKAVIASGARAVAPPIPGLAEAGYLDNETVFSLTERPERLAVIGAGPIGCELAQSFQRLGSQVTLFERADQILTREDPDAARIVQTAMERDGVEMVFSCDLERVERRGAEKVLHVRCPREGGARDRGGRGAGRRRSRAERGGHGPRGGGRALRPARGRGGGRPPAHQPAAHLRRRRLLHAVEVHPRRPMRPRKSWSRTRSSRWAPSAARSSRTW